MVSKGLKQTVFYKMRVEVEETVIVVETTCIFSEVLAEVEEIVDY
jgi:hypothetical protein